ncbi:MAG: hypothetical protein K0Q75_667, partial [Anaerospora sp.]|nr:hypothetical protein [Anaerospora sp.]
VGAKETKDLLTVPFQVTGLSREWLMNRRIDTTQYATRKKHG